MRIALVTSWPPRHCGIATYSNELVRALRKQGHEVFVVTFTDGGRNSERFVRNILPLKKGTKAVKLGWDEKLYKAVARIRPDIVHIQHEYALYNAEDDHSAGLLRALFRWRVEAECPTVITYHSVYSVLDREQSFYMDSSLKLANAGIVHEEYQKIHLPVNMGRVAENVYVIPHGAKDAEAVKDAKTHYGLDGKKVVGLLGWWEPNKGFERVIRLWPEIHKALGKNSVLVVAGDARPGSSSGQMYKPTLLRLVEKSRAKKSIRLIVDAFTPQEYDKVLSSFDLMVLPYNRASQSGNLAHSFALGVPVVATAMEGLKAEVENSKAGIAVPINDDLELKYAIIRVMKNVDLQKRYSKRAFNYVTKNIKWSIIAKKHVSLYKKVIRELREECRPKKKEWE